MSAKLGSVILLAVVAGLSQPAAAQTRACQVEPFRGASSPQGATAHMSVIRDGSTCSITNFGVPGEYRNPADSGRILVKPLHGVAEFSAPKALYQPEPGYVGEDEFAYDAFAKGNADQPVYLRVRVKVSVVAP